VILDGEDAAENALTRQRLIGLLSTGECVALVGAGCSEPAGFPLWGAFLRDLEAMAVCLSVPFEANEEARITNPLGYAREIADHCVGNELHDRYLQWLQRQFDRDVVPPRLTRWLVSLPFRAFLTTNYDRVLELGLTGEGVDFDWVDVQRDTPFTLSKRLQAVSVTDGKVGVFHLHGHHRAPELMVVNEADYDRAYGRISTSASIAPASFVLSSLLGTRPIVFLGFSFQDRHLTEVLERVTRDGWSWGAGYHYAVMPITAEGRDESLTEARRFREEFGVETVFYEVEGGDYSGFAAVVEQLAGELGVVPASETRVGTSRMQLESGPGSWSRRLTRRAVERAQAAADPAPAHPRAEEGPDAN
jgi:hypothetical protein